MARGAAQQAPLTAAALVCVLLPTLFWGSNVVVARGLVQGMPAPGLIVARWSLAALILLAFAGPSLWRQRRLAWAHRGTLLLLGVTGIAGFNSLVYLALAHTTAVNGSLIQGGIPITVVCLSWLTGGERATGRTLVAMAIAFAGLAVIVTHGDLETLWALRFNPGDALIALGIWLWGFYIVMVNRRPTGLTPGAFLLAIVLVGETALLVSAAVGLLRPLAFEPTPARLAGIAYIATFPSAIAYYLWNRGVAAIGPNRAGQSQYLLPVFGSLFAVLLLGETFALYNAVGTVLVLGGVYLVTAARTR